MKLANHHDGQDKFESFAEKLVSTFERHVHDIRLSQRVKKADKPLVFIDGVKFKMLPTHRWLSKKMNIFWTA